MSLLGVRPILLLLGLSLLGCLHRNAPPHEAQESQREIVFADRVWTVRPRSGLAVPGPNHWSDAPSAVWVDTEGLHLVLDQDQDQWRAVELSTALPPDAVHVAATLASPLDALDPSAVGAVFVYRDDQHEADIEFSRWGRPEPQAPNVQFAVAPYGPSQRHRFQVDGAAAPSEHVLDWRANRVAFHSEQDGEVVAEWRDTAEHWRQRQGYRLLINLWMYEGRRPAGPSELVFSRIVIE